ncbi:hypothetical protein C8Q80DRAFT_830427 [Daedaleopsis nitida]|nr:hypothetical protein C8Q80DRAFT_830427 [Daedaleopsis nitida]
MSVVLTYSTLFTALFLSLSPASTVYGIPAVCLVIQISLNRGVRLVDFGRFCLGICRCVGRRIAFGFLRTSRAQRDFEQNRAFAKAPREELLQPNIADVEVRDAAQGIHELQHRVGGRQSVVTQEGGGQGKSRFLTSILGFDTQDSPQHLPQNRLKIAHSEPP